MFRDTPWILDGHRTGLMRVPQPDMATFLKSIHPAFLASVILPPPASTRMSSLSNCAAETSQSSATIRRAQTPPRTRPE